jgi:hypothetical protein
MTQQTRSSDSGSDCVMSERPGQEQLVKSPGSVKTYFMAKTDPLERMGKA